MQKWALLDSISTFKVFSAWCTQTFYGRIKTLSKHCFASIKWGKGMALGFVQWGEIWWEKIRFFLWCWICCELVVGQICPFLETLVHETKRYRYRDTSHWLGQSQIQKFWGSQVCFELWVPLKGLFWWCFACFKFFFFQSRDWELGTPDHDYNFFKNHLNSNFSYLKFNFTEYIITRSLGPNLSWQPFGPAFFPLGIPQLTQCK